MLAVIRGRPQGGGQTEMQVDTCAREPAISKLPESDIQVRPARPSQKAKLIGSA